MHKRVSMADYSTKVGDFLEGRLKHEQLVEWAREAMLAEEMPPGEQKELMDLLQDLCISTPRSLTNAAKNYHRLNSPLVKGTPMDPRRN